MIEAHGPFDLIAAYDSGHSSERYSQVLLGGRYTVYAIPAGDWMTVEAGDLLVVHGDAEVTTERNTNTEFVTRITVRRKSPNHVYEVSEENGCNIDLDRHHEKVSQSGMWVAPATEDVRIEWVWGAFNGSKQPQYLEVGGGLAQYLDYGRLICLHYRKKSCVTSP